MAYVRPQVTVAQNMTIVPTTTDRDQPAFVFGPNYELHRYDNAEEKAKTSIGAFEGSIMRERYPGAIDEEMVDTEHDYTKLTGDNVVVELVNLGSASLPEVHVPPSQRAINGGYTQMFYSDEAFIDYDTEGKKVTRSSELPKNLAVGDTLRVSYMETGATNYSFIQTTIADIKYVRNGYNLDSDSSSEVEGAGTLITLFDAIPEGVQVDSVSIMLVGILNGVQFTKKNICVGTGYQWKEISWEANDEMFYGVYVTALNAEVRGYWKTPTYCTVVYADLFVTFRELITSNSDTLHSLTGAASVSGLLGTVDPDNPLAMGVYMAALNSATDDGFEAPPIYYMSVPSDDIDGYKAVLNRATLTDKAYVFAPTTRDEAVLEVVQAHVTEMSTATVKQWRIGAASAEIPETTSKLNSAMDPQGQDFLAIPATDAGIAPGQTGGKYKYFRVVKSVDNVNGNTDTKFGVSGALTGLSKGDIVRFKYRTNSWGEKTYDEYIVKKIVNNYTVMVDVSLSGYIDVDGLGVKSGNLCYVPEKIEIEHPYTAAESAELIASISRNMGSRRMLNVFPSVFKNNGVQMTGEFAACAVAGLISATLPQQPITNVNVRGIDDIPLVYLTYNKTELDTIAAGGTFIVAQDLPEDQVYVRHQVTTATKDGNLNTRELSITKNVDSISYAFAEVFRPYYGKYNVTPELLATFENLAVNLINQLAKSTTVYGPQLIAEETEIKYIRQNEMFKDHVDIAITLGVPYPCNNIDIVLTV